MGDRSARRGKGESRCRMRLRQPGGGKSSPKPREYADSSRSLRGDALGRGKGSAGALADLNSVPRNPSRPLSRSVPQFPHLRSGKGVAAARPPASPSARHRPRCRRALPLSELEEQLALGKQQQKK